MSTHGLLRELENRWRFCHACHLRSGCRQVVFGEGNPSAALMFVGQAPGAEEDRQGRPFVGPAGKLLNRLLARLGFSRKEVYITSVVKCRPPGDRPPTREEIAACRPYLFEQIRLIRPRIIVCLGTVAAQALIGNGARVTRIRGQWFQVQGALVLPTFHPAAVLRDRAKLPLVLQDLREVSARLRFLQKTNHPEPHRKETPAGGRSQAGKLPTP